MSIQQLFTTPSRRLIATTALLASSFLFSASAQATDFITHWEMPAGDLTLTFPGSSTTTYDIDWGDGESSMGVSGLTDHDYTPTGARTYTVRATRTITRFATNLTSDAGKLTNVSQWGTANWTSMENAFQDASVMTMTAPDAPDLSAVMSMDSMFARATNFNIDISGWDVSNVREMGQMFLQATNFNQNISDWDVSKVTDMRSMFLLANAFGQNLGAWYVTSTTSSLTPSLMPMITAQNRMLNDQNPSYALVNEGDVFNLNGSTLTPVNPALAHGTYTVEVTATGSTLFPDDTPTTTPPTHSAMVTRL